MTKFFAPNIDGKGRWIRGLLGLAFLIAAALVGSRAWWAGLLLAVYGVFALFEAARGWCVVRACGIKTKF